jgi:hypothetical protein
MVGFKGCVAIWFTLLVNVVTAVPASHKTGPVHKRMQTASIPAADGVFKGRRNGPLEYHRTLSKYNIPIPQGLQKVVDRYLLKLPADESTYLHVHTYQLSKC